MAKQYGSFKSILYMKHKPSIVFYTLKGKKASEERVAKLAQVAKERQIEMEVKERMKITENKIAQLSEKVAGSMLQQGMYT